MCPDCGPIDRDIQLETSVAAERAENIHVGAGSTKEGFVALRPCVAEVDPVAGTEQCCNILRHKVQTDPRLLTLRVDGSLYFVNVRYLEDYILNRVTGDTALQDVILMCSAVDKTDMSPLESLEVTKHRLHETGIHLNLSKVKAPVMCHLIRSDFLQERTGSVYLSEYDAFRALGSPDRSQATTFAERETHVE
jgi:SulP family sulfate permease